LLEFIIFLAYETITCFYNKKLKHLPWR
jgi:4-hydroxybenzoate polyprenyltransferase